MANLSRPTMAALAELPVWQLQEGQRCWVDAEQTDFHLRKTGAVPAADGVNFIASIYPGAVWQRAATSAAEAVSLPLSFIINGQSNAAAAPAVPFGYSELTPLLGPDVLGFWQTSQTMVQVVDGSANARANQAGGGTGPGPGLGQIGTRLARHLADETGQTIRTYALAYSGQPISVFRKGSLTKAYFEDGSQHPTLNNYDLLKSYVATAGHVPQLYLWVQGEANAGMTPDEYYAQIAGHWNDLQADYPWIRMLIVGTIQGAPYKANDRGSVLASTVAGVRKAQKRLADECPDRVLFVDTTDMRAFSAAFWNNHYSTFGTTSAGYEEVELRAIAKVRGEPDRPAVPQVQHPQDIFSFDCVWAQRRSMNGQTMALWWDDIGNKTLDIEAGSPEHISSDPNFGRRCVTGFDGVGDRLIKTGVPGGSKFTIYGVLRLARSGFNIVPRCVIQFFTNGVGTLAFAFNESGGHKLFLNVASHVFPGIANSEGDIAHSYLVNYDGVAQTAQLYIDGFLMSEMTGLPSVDVSSTTLVRVGSFSGAWPYKGEIAYLGYKANPPAFPTAEMVAAMHAGSRFEYKLET